MRSRPAVPVIKRCYNFSNQLIQDNFQASSSASKGYKGVDVDVGTCQIQWRKSDGIKLSRMKVKLHGNGGYLGRR